MRNVHLFEQFMQENGINYDEPFTIEIKDGDKLETKDLILRSIGFGGTDIDVIDANTNKRILDEEGTLFMLLFPDDVKIIKKPWKPKYDDIYWYASIDGRVYSTTWTKHNDDIHRYILGNCFKTKEEAEKYKRDVFKMLDGEPLVKREK